MENDKNGILLTIEPNLVPILLEEVLRDDVTDEAYLKYSKLKKFGFEISIDVYGSVLLREKTK